MSSLARPHVLENMTSYLRKAFISKGKYSQQLLGLKLSKVVI